MIYCWFVAGNSWSGHCVAVGHSCLLCDVVDVGVLESKSAVVAKVLGVSSQEMLWFASFEVANALE